MAKNVVVIGAGIVGVSAAVRLLEAGHRVTLVDRGLPGEGTSFGNAGIIATGSITPLSTPGVLGKVPGYLMDATGPLRLRWGYLPKALPWLRSFLKVATRADVERIADGLSALLHDALDEHIGLARITGAMPWIRTGPYYFTYPDEAAFKGDEFIWRVRRERGVRYDTIKGEALHREVPALSPDVQFAVVLHNHGFVLDPMRLVKAHADHFVRSGGKLLTLEVKDIECGPEGPRRLITSADPIEVETLVVTAGAWSTWMAEKLGAKIPLESERGYHITIRNPGIDLPCPVGSASGKFIATPMTPGIRIAGTVEFAGLEAPPDPKRFDALIALARRLLPDIDTSDYTTWLGHRPSIPDSLPVVGPAPKVPNVFFGFGHQHVGLTAGPKTGRLLAELVSGTPVNLDLSPYRADRF